ncbi:ricin-type beta-trefoil lectin domain protein [Kitasatospora sp. NBC_01287]|uniref:ricin-type beta-trefoil lectin domain protein n=1 Tax=Kitasatospora sp. NBC_01287 TaxID=2903573 RepID=UPI00225538D5|nr:ricin-type beta-trefoil lectin domain protein [Kitasatospora sp. NBC_01287]MCX4746132.1 ricin-type beta-trefoil lectin domain protein [Kitasatospora sp. NBC_01287]
MPFPVFEHKRLLPRRALPRRAAKAAIAVAATLAVATGALLTTPTPASAQPGSSSDAFNSLTAQSHSDWMSQVPDGTGLGAMSIPGTHDTLAIHGGLAPWAYEAQEDHGDSAATLTAQLDAGIRAIDIRVRVIGGAFAIHHTDVYQDANFDDVLTRAQAFLTAHPGETILMDLHGECDADSTEGGSGSSSIGHCADDPSNTTTADRIGVFDGYLARYPGLFYAPTVTGTSTAATPSLGQVRGHIVLTDFTGPVGEVYPGFGLSQLTGGEPGGGVENDWGQCDLTKKWNEAQSNLANAAADPTGALYVTYTSSNCAPLGADPADMAGGYLGGEGENQRLLDRLDAGAPGKTGILRMDFPGWAVVAGLIDRNPGIWRSGQVTAGIPGKCLDDYTDATAPGATVDLYSCNGTPAQQWRPATDGTLRINNLCLDVTGAATAQGSPVELWGCNGGANQQWTAGANGALVSAQSGRCLDDPSSSTADGTRLQIWSCNGTAAQAWALPS